MNENKVKPQLEQKVVYIKDGITYVPHYRNSKIFVGPGYPKFNTSLYSENDLLSAGAEQSSLFLWTRGTTGAISKVNQ